MFFRNNSSKGIFREIMSDSKKLKLSDLLLLISTLNARAPLPPPPPPPFLLPCTKGNMHSTPTFVLVSSAKPRRKGWTGGTGEPSRIPAPVLLAPFGLLSESLGQPGLALPQSSDRRRWLELRLDRPTASRPTPKRKQKKWLAETNEPVHSQAQKVH